MCRTGNSSWPINVLLQLGFNWANQCPQKKAVDTNIVSVCGFRILLRCIKYAAELPSLKNPSYKWYWTFPACWSLSLCNNFFHNASFRIFWQWVMAILTSLTINQAWCAAGPSKTLKYVYVLTFIWDFNISSLAYRICYPSCLMQNLLFVLSSVSQSNHPLWWCRDIPRFLLQQS